MAGDAAWFNPVVLNPDALPALLHPLPMDHPERVDYVMDEAPFAIHEEFLGGHPRDFPRNLTNLDIAGSQPKYQIKYPLDPMVKSIFILMQLLSNIFLKENTVKILTN